MNRPGRERQTHPFSRLNRRCLVYYTWEVKQRDLIRKLEKAATARQVSFVFVREGANHTVYSFGGQNVIIPRHREINERTAQSILKGVGIEWQRTR